MDLPAPGFCLQWKSLQSRFALGSNNVSKFHPFSVLQCLSKYKHKHCEHTCQPAQQVLLNHSSYTALLEKTCKFCSKISFKNTPPPIEVSHTEAISLYTRTYLELGCDWSILPARMAASSPFPSSVKEKKMLMINFTWTQGNMVKV